MTRFKPTTNAVALILYLLRNCSCLLPNQFQDQCRVEWRMKVNFPAWQYTIWCSIWLPFSAAWVRRLLYFFSSFIRHGLPTIWYPSHFIFHSSKRIWFTVKIESKQNRRGYEQNQSCEMRVKGNNTKLGYIITDRWERNGMILALVTGSRFRIGSPFIAPIKSENVT